MTTLKQRLELATALDESYAREYAETPPITDEMPGVIYAHFLAGQHYAHDRLQPILAALINSVEALERVYDLAMPGTNSISIAASIIAREALANLEKVIGGECG